MDGGARMSVKRTKTTYEELKQGWLITYKKEHLCTKTTYEELKLGFVISSDSSSICTKTTYEELKLMRNGKGGLVRMTVPRLPMRN